MKQINFAIVNHTQIRSWNQPVLISEGKVSCSRSLIDLTHGWLVGNHTLPTAPRLPSHLLSVNWTSKVKAHVSQFGLLYTYKHVYTLMIEFNWWIMTRTGFQSQVFTIRIKPNNCWPNFKWFAELFLQIKLILCRFKGQLYNPAFHSAYTFV